MRVERVNQNEQLRPVITDALPAYRRRVVECIDTLRSQFIEPVPSTPQARAEVDDGSVEIGLVGVSPERVAETRAEQTVVESVVTTLVFKRKNRYFFFC